MTESSTTSRDFAPSWLRTSNHSPTPPFRSLANPGLKDRTSDDWPDRKNPGFPRWNVADNQSDSYFNHHNQGRLSDYDHVALCRTDKRSRSLQITDHSLRRSNSINSGSIRGNSLSSSRSNGSSQNLWSGRSKFDSHFRQTNGFQNGFPFRDSHNSNPNGISYSFVTSKSLKPAQGPTSPILQQSDFPSLSPLKEPLAKPTQSTVWGNPPHLSKITKRSQSYLENGNNILGSHYGKGFFTSALGRDFKDDLNDVLSNVCNDHGSDNYPKNEFEDHLHVEGDTQQESPGKLRSDEEVQLENDDVPWNIDDMPHSCQPNERGGSLISSTGSTGSVESIDSHQSHMSGAAMMVEDLLDETISEDEKMRILHALDEIKERTGFESYYERIALTEGRVQPRLSFIVDGKNEEDEEDPDDRFLK